ncbi:MAG: phytanoyl-CoA dioxygenase family protein [Pseudomonadota bacterium]
MPQDAQPLASPIAKRFNRDGFAFPLRAMDAATAARYRAELEVVEAEVAEDKARRKCLRRYPNLVLPFVDEISRLPAIVDPIAEILGPDLLVLDCPFFIKEPKTTHFVSWHQDLHYWGLDGDEEVTAWVALSPATTTSGCMRFVAGSHRRIVDHIDTFDDENLLTRGQEVAVDVDERDATEGELQPGEFSIHNGRVFHASHPNASDDRRIGLAIRYIPTRMKQAPGGTMAAMLVRGEDRCGNFRLTNRPSGTMLPADLAHWQDIAGARNAVLGGRS